MRRLGIDPGERRIGLARTAVDSSIAMPWTTLARAGTAESVAATIRSLVEGEHIEEIVVGLPLRLDGTEGASARRARILGGRLQALLPSVPVVYWDERMTSRAAERALKTAGASRGTLRRATDASAASLILQSYIDANTRTNQQWPDDEHDRPPASPTDALVPRRDGRGRWPSGR